MAEDLLSIVKEHLDNEDYSQITTMLLELNESTDAWTQMDVYLYLTMESNIKYRLSFEEFSRLIGDHNYKNIPPLEIRKGLAKHCTEPKIFDYYYNQILNHRLSLDGGHGLPPLDHIGFSTDYFEGDAATNLEFVKYFISKITSINDATDLEFRYYLSLLALSKGKNISTLIWKAIDFIIQTEKRSRTGESLRDSKTLLLMEVLTLIRDEVSLNNAKAMYLRDWSKLKFKSPIDSSAIRPILQSCINILVAIPCKESMEFLLNKQLWKQSEQIRFFWDFIDGTDMSLLLGDENLQYTLCWDLEKEMSMHTFGILFEYIEEDFSGYVVDDKTDFESFVFTWQKSGPELVEMGERICDFRDLIDVDAIIDNAKEINEILIEDHFHPSFVLEKFGITK